MQKTQCPCNNYLKCAKNLNVTLRIIVLKYVKEHICHFKIKNMQEREILFKNMQKTQCHFENYCFKKCKNLNVTSIIIVLKCTKNSMSLRE